MRVCFYVGHSIQYILLFQIDAIMRRTFFPPPIYTNFTLFVFPTGVHIFVFIVVTFVYATARAAGQTVGVGAIVRAARVSRRTVGHLDKYISL